MRRDDGREVTRTLSTTGVHEGGDKVLMNFRLPTVTRGVRAADVVQLDEPQPHVAFGSGSTLCRSNLAAWSCRSRWRSGCPDS